MDIVPNCRSCLRHSLSYIDLETSFEQNVIGISLEIQPAAYTTFMDCFRYCTQLKAADCEEEMPQSICEQCAFELGIAWNFLQKAVASDQILRNSLDNLKTEYHTHEVLVDGESDISQNSGEEIEPIKESIENDSNLENANDNAVYECYSNDISVTKKGYIIEMKPEVVSANTTSELSQNDEHQSVTTNICQNSLSNLPDNDFDVLEVEETGTRNNEDQPTTGSSQFEHMTNNNLSDESRITMSKEMEAISMSVCPSSFQKLENGRAVTSHMPKEGKNVFCKICGHKITKEETMHKHLKNVHSNIIDCSQCDYKCPAFKMSDHMHRTHGEPRNFACIICGKTFVNQSIWNSHVKYHQRKEANIKSDACEVCGKRFSTQHYLRLHMDVHRNERQLHQCDYCDKMYISKIAFENHIRLHKGETIKCDQCGKQFVRKYELNVHMRFHTRDYPFKCEVCDKKFAIKGHLRTHMWRHQGLKLQCEECGKLFTSTKALQEHSFVHSEMPYPCTYCGRGYPSKQKFKVHLKTTHLIDLTEDELLKITKLRTRQPLQRKKLTLVQADSVMKEVEVKDGEGETTTNEGDLFVELF